MGELQTTASEAPDQREFGVDGAFTSNRSSPFRFVLSHLWRHPWPIVGFVTCVLTLAVLTSTLPRLIGYAFDAVVAGEADRLWPLGLLMIGVSTTRVIVDLGGSFLVEWTGQRLERNVRDDLYVALLGKSQTFHDRQRVGDVMARAANDVRQLSSMMNPGVSLIVESGLAIVVPVVFIATIDPRLVVAPLAFVVAFGWALRAYMNRLQPVSGALRARFGEMNAGLNQAVTGIEVVKGQVQETAELDRFVGDATRYRDQFVEQGRIQARYLPVLLLGLATAGGFAQGLYLLANGAITVGDLVAFVGLMATLRFAAFISIFTFSLVQLGMAGAQRILDLVKARTELDENRSGHVATVSGAIAFEEVSFAYAPDKPDVLRDVSFALHPGQTVAIVGQTGSGKSTLTQLVNRTYDPTAGTITIDGVDLREWNLQSLREQISVIEQDVFLFSRSIAENIGFGLGERATPEAIQEAAKLAQAHDFILEFAEGYDTVVGERGATLSGGQRQRIAIARALLTDPRILIIDDSTSAVDSATEDRIQRAIGAVRRGRTTLMITHRLYQIRRADWILVLERGRLVEQGPHDVLIEQSERYQRIFARVPRTGTDG
ncbi:MAG: ABC transporter ATP-binding protein [Myxococcota bacterium]